MSLSEPQLVCSTAEGFVWYGQQSNQPSNNNFDGNFYSLPKPDSAGKTGSVAQAQGTEITDFPTQEEAADFAEVPRGVLFLYNAYVVS